MTQKSTHGSGHDKSKAPQPQQQQQQQPTTTRQQRQQQHQRNQNGLPVSIHPDDAKDKVFTAILKALLKMGNKPSSPKELANIIVKYKYATLGGATPFATVSSRISQHFKRAAEHNPPRPPLLAKHVDQNHSRKINYSLATTSNDTIGNQEHTEEAAIEEHDVVAASTAAPAASTSTSPSNMKASLRNARKDKSRQPQQQQNTSTTSQPSQQRGKRSKMSIDHAESSSEEEDETITENRTIHHTSKKHKTTHPYPFQSPPRLLVNNASDDEEGDENEDEEDGGMLTPFPRDVGKDDAADESEDSEGEHSDYHEEMLKSDDLNMLTTQPLKNIRRPSYLKLSTNYHVHKSINNHDTPSLPTSTASHAPLSSIATSSTTNNKNSIPPPLESITAARKPSFSLGDQEFWTPFSFEHDFDNVFLSHDTSAVSNNGTSSLPPPPSSSLMNAPNTTAAASSTALTPLINPTIPFNIATPESISVSELETYFANTPSPSSSGEATQTSDSSASNAKQSKSSPLANDASMTQEDKSANKFNKAKRKSFSSTMLGPNDKSLLQKVLLTSAARGVAADKIDEEDEEDGKEEAQSSGEVKVEEKTDNASTATISSAKQEEPVSQTLTSSSSSSSSSSSLNVTELTNGEDFVQFEDDEKKEDATATAPSSPKSFNITTEKARASSGKATPMPILPASPNTAITAAAASPVKKMAEILPASTANGAAAFSSTSGTTATTQTNTNAATLAAAELFKNNLSAIHQLTSSIPSLQYLTPTLDLAKTMAIYMQTLAKTANASSSSSAQQSANNYAMDLKSILARFPALEAFLKKDPASTTTSSTPSTSTATAVTATTGATPSITAAVAPSGLSTPPLVSPTTADFPLHTPAHSTTAPSTPTTPTLGVSPAASLTTTNIPTTTTAGSSTSTNASFNTQPTTLSPSPTASTPDIAGSSTEPVIHSLQPTQPPMYITVVDHIAVCVVVLPMTDTAPEYRIMRRIDTNFINGTVLLTAGGIETESERSMILSFEMERIRMPKKKSQLFGTWIPLRRAQELAVTCSIQHKLGHFLDDRIDTLFPSPLPLPLPAHTHGHSTAHALLKNKRGVMDHRWTALALAALKETSANAAAVAAAANNGGIITGKRSQSFVVPPISRQSSSSGSMAVAQLQELLMTHPHKALKSNGKAFMNDPTISGPASPTTPTATTSAPLLLNTVTKIKTTNKGKARKSSSEKKKSKAKGQENEKDENSDVDIVNTSSDSSPTLSSTDDLSDIDTIATSAAQGTNTTSATANTITGNAKNTNVPTASASTPLVKNPKLLQLEELLSRVAASKQQQPLHVHPRDLQKKRRIDSVDTNNSRREDDVDNPSLKKSAQANGSTKTSKSSSAEPARKRANTGNGSGKFSSSDSTAASGNKSSSGSNSSSQGTTITIKRSGSTNNKKAGGKSKQQQQQSTSSQQKKAAASAAALDAGKADNEKWMNKTIVEKPKPSSTSLNTAATKSPSTTNTHSHPPTQQAIKSSNTGNHNSTMSPPSTSATISAPLPNIAGGTTIKLEHNEENEEDDEDIDIGGSDCDDDLR